MTLKHISLSLFCALAFTACTPKAVVDKAGKNAKAPSNNAQNSGAGQDGKQTDGKDEGSSASGGTGDATVYVINDSVEMVCFVYLGDGAGAWTDDMLGDNILDIGYFLTVTGVPAGTVEVYAEGCNGSDWYGSAEVSAEYTFVLTGGSSTGDTGSSGETGGGGGDTGSDTGARMRGGSGHLPAVDNTPKNMLDSWYEALTAWW